MFHFLDYQITNFFIIFFPLNLLFIFFQAARPEERQNRPPKMSAKELMMGTKKVGTLFFLPPDSFHLISL